jgi:hypothetical protein
MSSLCAICRAPAPPRSENPFAPFCSVRCRTIDLGKWIDGDYRVPVATDDIADDPEALAALEQLAGPDR